MAVPAMYSPFANKTRRKWIYTGALCASLMCALAIPARADEIRLKDGKKLYGVIVAYEDNMFKIKTDFGYVLVEKDKIASIVPSTPAAATPAKSEPKPAAKKEPAEPAKPATEQVKAPAKDEIEPQAEPAVASSKVSGATPSNAKPAASFSADASKPKMPGGKPAAAPLAPAVDAKSATAAKVSSAATPAAAGPAAPPKEPEIPANREEIQGNYYTNYTHGFRMYKPPSWSLIEDARNTLPNAIVAMGTSNESTLMVVGQEKTKEPLDAAAANVEKRLQEVYDNYQRISQRKMAVGGLSAVEYHYRGRADDHAWSGTLVVVARGGDILTLLGMTYADTDLIQIQENLIARSISSLDFNAH
jgi:hypothetical protein